MYTLNNLQNRKTRGFSIMEALLSVMALAIGISTAIYCMMGTLPS